MHVTMARSRPPRREIVIGMGTATVAAVGLWAVGLEETTWAPFFLLAAGTYGRGCTVARPDQAGS